MLIRKRKRLKVNLVGGLGNQMYGYAAGLYFANKNNYELVVDLSHVASHHTLDCFTADSFNLEGNIRDWKWTRKFAWKTILRIIDSARYRSEKFEKFCGKLNLEIRESDIEKSIDFSIKPGSTLLGHFSTFKYYDEITKINQTEIFTLKNEIPRVFEKLLKTKSIGIHLRRGDYIQASESHGLLNTEYYVRGLREIDKRENYDQILILSDDQKAASKLKEAILKDFTDRKDSKLIETVVPGRSADPAESLILLSKCSGLIIANSTFSLWAARLSKPNTSVIYPLSFFKSPADARFYSYPGWLGIESKWE